MDAQEEHDYVMSERMKGGKSVLEKGSRQRLESLLAKKSGVSPAKDTTFGLGPIERAMRDHPGLTRETAEKMAEEFGF